MQYQVGIDIGGTFTVLAGISACPSDKARTNNGRPNPLGIKVFAL